MVETNGNYIVNDVCEETLNTCNIREVIKSINCVLLVHFSGWLRHSNERKDVQNMNNKIDGN